MKKVKLILGSLAFISAIIFTACDASTNGNVAGSGGNEEEVYDKGQAGDTANNMNNGGNYTPDNRSENRGGQRNDSTVGTTGSKFDAQGNSTTGNNDVHSNRQQDATTGGNSNTEKRKAGE